MIFHLIKEHVKTNFLEAEIFFPLLFVLEPKDFCSALLSLLGVFGIVVYWCSCQCYICMLFLTGLKKTYKKKGQKRNTVPLIHNASFDCSLKFPMILLITHLGRL